ncbi:MAG: hypothetical protein EA351_09545 [Gemmatimonadales bacterium]|nr:MAG: hypothetical protein EA351_09545 [Gemmatimonadales bacterium]
MNSMLWRTVLGTFAGYAAIFVWTVLTFTLWWWVLGQEMAFHPGTAEVTGAWLAGTLPLNLVGAVLGGWVAARVGGRPASRPAVVSLLLVLVILGVWMAITQTTASDEAVVAIDPASDLSPFEAAAVAIQPLWISWVLPALGGLGVWMGGVLGHPRPEAGPTERP